MTRAKRSSLDWLEAAADVDAIDLFTVKDDVSTAKSNVEEAKANLKEKAAELKGVVRKAQGLVERVKKSASQAQKWSVSWEARYKACAERFDRLPEDVLIELEGGEAVEAAAPLVDLLQQPAAGAPDLTEALDECEEALTDFDPETVREVEEQLEQLEAHCAKVRQ